jgi:hypothetical protein
MRGLHKVGYNFIVTQVACVNVDEANFLTFADFLNGLSPAGSEDSSQRRMAVDQALKRGCDSGNVDVSD